MILTAVICFDWFFIGFVNHLNYICRTLGISLELFASYKPETIKKQAYLALRSLAAKVTAIEAEGLDEPEVADRHLVAKQVFSDAYTLFRRTGIIEDVGYRKFYPQKEKA